MFTNLRHIALAVPDLKAATDLYAGVFGVKISAPQPLPEHGVTSCFMQVGGVCFELLEPLGPSSPLQGFLEKNPKGGMHHVCYGVPDLDQALGQCREKGLNPLGQPRVGAHGHRVIFFHPSQTCGTLIELEEILSEKQDPCSLSLD